MKTTHQIARELLDMPDVPLHIEGWRMGWDDEIVVREADHILSGVILMNRESPISREDEEEGYSMR
jgi:hypothetical protein